MKLRSIVLSTAMACITPAMADSNIITVDFPIVCSDMKALSEMITEYREQPAMTMSSIRDAGGTQMINPLVLFVNYETKTWTMGERVAPDVICLIAVGDNIKPYQER